MEYLTLLRVEAHATLVGPKLKLSEVILKGSVVIRIQHGFINLNIILKHLHHGVGDAREVIYECYE